MKIIFLLLIKLWKIGKKTNSFGGFLAFSLFLWANITLVRYDFFYFGIIITLFSSFYDEKVYDLRKLYYQRKSFDAKLTQKAQS